MAFSVSAFQAALNACTNVEEWQALTSSIDIPEELFPDVYSRLLDLSFQDMEFEVSCITSLI